MDSIDIDYKTQVELLIQQGKDGNAWGNSKLVLAVCYALFYIGDAILALKDKDWKGSK